MSKGMPSMAALLGMIALAGYQNRDKLIEMFNSATAGSDAASNDGQPTGNSPDAATTGVRDLVDAFRKSGQGSVADSWVSSGRNEPIQPAQLEQAIGSDTLDRLVTETGLAKAEILKRMTADLPGAVDGLTPEGRV
ncbi:MAG: DUF937 domain-containing protein [Anderseniella sp.]|nr:DUF937 domain-containing protein [Anderseniella sp.]